MTQHPIHNLPPAELRGYARGLRETAALLHAAWNLVADGAEQECNVLVDATHASWLREADLVDGFAARLEAAPAKAMQKRQHHLYWCPGIHQGEAVADIEDALHSLGHLPHLEPAPLRSTRWPGQTRWAVRVPTCDGDTDVELFNTREEADAFVASAEAANQPATTETGARDLAHGAQPSRGEGDNAAPTAPLAAAPTPEEQRQPGLADAVAKSLAEQPPTKPEREARANGRPGGIIWTEAREALLAQLYPTIICTDALHQLLNALPGPPIASPQATRQHAAAMNLERRGEPLPEGYTDQPVSDRSPIGMAGRVKALAGEARPRTRRSDSPWTEERLALLRRLFPTIMHIDTIKAELEKLPGLPITGAYSVRQKGDKLGLHRRGEPIPKDFASAPASRTKQPQNAPEPAPTQPATPIKPTPEMLPEDKAEAREKLRTGEFKGARDIIEEYGCTQAEAQALVDEHRNRMGKAA